MADRPLLSTIVPSQLPDHIRNSHPVFVRFIEYYYQYMEQHEIDILRDRDIDTTNANFLIYFRNELGYNIPLNSATRFLLKNLRELYLTKGSELSFKFLFKALFDKNIQDIFYPQTKMIRVSTGLDRNTEPGGTISGDYYIQDSDYYQIYSYVLKAESPDRITENELEIVKNILHPAGMKVFRERRNPYNR